MGEIIQVTFGNARVAAQFRAELRDAITQQFPGVPVSTAAALVDIMVEQFEAVEQSANFSLSLNSDAFGGARSREGWQRGGEQLQRELQKHVERVLLAAHKAIVASVAIAFRSGREL